MTRIQEIAKSTDLSDEKSARAAAARMKAVTDHELHFYLVMRDTLNATTQETRQGIALAQVEADRRNRRSQRRLALLTTLVSGVVGLLGVALGAYLTKPSPPPPSPPMACPSQPVVSSPSCASSTPPAKALPK